MCRLAAADGCRAMIATPHLRHSRWWNGDRLQLEFLLEQLRREVLGEIELFTGGEIALHHESFEEILNEMPGGNLLPLAGSRYLLLEFDWHGVGPDPQEVVYEVCLRGFKPVIAHPERVAWLMTNRGLLETLVKEGALLQLTAMSVTGALGPVPSRASRQLLDAGLVHFVASDAHGPERRPPGLREARQVVSDTWGEEVAQDLFSRHPQAVLDNQPLETSARP